MKWLGLTGGIATGKSTVAEILRDLGRPVVDADVLAREVVALGTPGLASVIKTFGQEILLSNGEIDRPALGRKIFSDPVAREKLEQILHPLIQERRAEQRRALEREGCELAFYDVPLLFEKNMQDEFDATVLIYAPVEIQRERLRERNKLSDKEIESRLASQMPIDDKVRLATHVLLNETNFSDLRRQVRALVQLFE